MKDEQQTNPRIQEAYVWYDEKLKDHFLFCTIDGKEREGHRIGILDAAKLRDGKVTPEQLVERYFPWVMKEKNEEDRTQQAEVQPEQINFSTRQRFLRSGLGIMENLQYNATKMTAWVADIFNLAWNDDNIGAYKEFAKGVDYSERQVGKAIDYLHLEDAVAKARTYLLSLYDAGGQVLRADLGKAREASKPITNDIRALGSFIFIKSGLWPMLKNLGERAPEALKAVGDYFRGNRKEAKEAGKEFIRETGEDMKAILHSESAQKTAQRVLISMESFEKATKVNNERLQEMNCKPEQELDVKHPRLSQVRIYTNTSGMSHFVRCCIDGVQQMGKPLKEQDYTSWQLGNIDRYQLAEKYYSRDLENDLTMARSMAR